MGLPDSRGNWCKYCHVFWRLLYSSKCTLAMFAILLQTSANFNEWELLLVSYLSLKREGLERITESVVLIRRDYFRFCLRMLCLPETPFEIKSLADVTTAGVEHIDGREGCDSGGAAGGRTRATSAWLLGPASAWAVERLQLGSSAGP